MIRPPRDEERLLLVAATGGADRALAAWRDWRARVDFERLPDETVRLVPLLYRSLSRLGVAAPELARYASVYRHSWARNRLAFQAGARVIERLADAGIETIVLKGAAASVLYYRDDGVRAMEDVDVLVPRARLAATFEVLARAGWKVEQSRGPAPSARRGWPIGTRPGSATPTGARSICTGTSRPTRSSTTRTLRSGRRPCRCACRASRRARCAPPTSSTTRSPTPRGAARRTCAGPRTPWR